MDTEGLSRENRRLQELQANADQAKSASAGVFQIVASEVPNPEAFPADWADVSQVAMLTRVAGAALLFNSSAALTEAQRKENRRVELTLVTFIP